MKCRAPLASALVLLLALSGTAGAQVALFSENFDTNATANWNANSSSSTPNTNVADFFFDYSTVGIPSAPNSAGGSTRGLKLEANIPGGAAGVGGISASPRTSPIPAGLTNYTLRFDAWQNFNGPFPGGGTGSTQHTGAGFGTDGTTPQFPGTGGSVQGVTVSADADGGSAATSATPDFMAHKVAGTALTTGYAASGASPRDNADPYYASFGNVAAPAAQLALFPTQTGNTAAGALGMGWHTWRLARNGNTVTWSIDNLLIATIDISDKPFTAGTNFFVGHFDFFASVVPAAERPVLFGLIDNVVLTAVPEPSSLALVGVAAPVLLYLRRRSSGRAGSARHTVSTEGTRR
jgi:hypothetical protein